MGDSKGSNLFKIENVTKVYGEHYILNKVSFNIKEGEIFGIIGRSGTGKTTFLNMLVGLVKPEKGEIMYRDIHLLSNQSNDSFRSVHKHNKSLRRIYGFAAQKPSFYPNLTTWENLMYFGSLYDISKHSLCINAENLLKLVDLSQARNVVAKKMSGGMQRRLDIACSLVHDPKILILDEPTADLDPVLSNKIWNILRIISQKGTTVILASHHVIELENLCDRIAIMKEGRVVALGKPEEIKAKNVVEERIFIKSSPGRYKKVISELQKKTIKNIQSYKIKDRMLVIETIKTNKVINNLLKVLDNLGEEIIDIEFRKPTLDKIFMKIDEKSDDKEIEFDAKKSSEKKSSKKLDLKKKEKADDNRSKNILKKEKKQSKKAVKEITSRKLKSKSKKLEKESIIKDELFGSKNKKDKFESVWDQI